MIDFKIMLFGVAFIYFDYSLTVGHSKFLPVVLTDKISGAISVCVEMVLSDVFFNYGTVINILKCVRVECIVKTKIIYKS